MPQKTQIFLFAIIILFISYFWFRGVQFLDPDFGWHLQMGRLILSQGIPATDPFSYTMASYPFVDHEWLTNILFAKAMDTLGYNMFAGVFAISAVTAFFLQIQTLSQQAKRFALPFFFLTLLSVSGFVGIRPQILTWLFFSLVLIVVRDFRLFVRYRWFLPLLFVLWVNLHGGFAVGIVELILASGYWWYKKPSDRLQIAGVLFASMAATFAMPYGWRGWWEVWMQMTDGQLRWTIMEWTPTIFVPSMSLWLFVVFSVMFVGRYLKKFSLLDLLFYAGLLIAGLSSIRHMPLWFLIGLPMTVEAVRFFYQDITKIPYAIARFRRMTMLFVIFIAAFAVFDLQSLGYSLGMFGKQGMYPEHAVVYLRSHQPQGQIFSTYDWGGYLIWKNSSKKVFIDGRMPSWRWQADLENESNYAFEEYRKFVEGEIPFRTVTEKYGIGTLLLPVAREVKKNPVENIVFDFAKNVLHLPLKDYVGYTKLVNSAQKAGWEIVYQDETAVVYQR